MKNGSWVWEWVILVVYGLLPRIWDGNKTRPRFYAEMTGYLAEKAPGASKCLALCQHADTPLLFLGSFLGQKEH